MKKSFLVAATILMPVLTLFAHDSARDSANSANLIIRNQFTTDFPDAKDAHFARVENLNKMSFIQDKEKMSAYYDDGGQLVGTIHEKLFADLPGNAQKEIRHKYPNYAIAGVVKLEDDGSDYVERVEYGISMYDADNYFVELKNDTKAILVKVDLSGDVNYLTTVK
jgi:hypothetical protein